MQKRYKCFVYRVIRLVFVDTLLSEDVWKQRSTNSAHKGVST